MTSLACGSSQPQATQLSFLTEPTETLSNEHFSPAIQVAIQDADQNTITSATHSVELAFEANPTEAVLNGTTTVSAQGGIASFPDLSIDGSGRGFALRATSGDLTPAVSAEFGVWATLQQIEEVNLSETTLVIDGDSVSYTATVINHEEKTYTNIVFQAWVDQGASSRAAGGSMIHCGELGVLEPGTCLVNYIMGATNAGAGTGTLVPGEALARFDLRQQQDIFDTVSVPITLTD